MFDNDNIWIVAVEDVLPDEHGDMHIADIEYKGIKFKMHRCAEYFEVQELNPPEGRTGYFWDYSVDKIIDFIKDTY